MEVVEFIEVAQQRKRLFRLFRPVNDDVVLNPTDSVYEPDLKVVCTSELSVPLVHVELCVEYTQIPSKVSQ